MLLKRKIYADPLDFLIIKDMLLLMKRMPQSLQLASSSFIQLETKFLFLFIKRNTSKS